MAHRIAVSTLNASTIDILNTIAKRSKDRLEDMEDYSLQDGEVFERCAKTFNETITLLDDIATLAKAAAE